MSHGRLFIGTYKEYKRTACEGLCIGGLAKNAVSLEVRVDWIRRTILSSPGYSAKKRKLLPHGFIPLQNIERR